jgi:hypothetical protein
MKNAEYSVVDQQSDDDIDQGEMEELQKRQDYLDSLKMLSDEEKEGRIKVIDDECQYYVKQKERYSLSVAETVIVNNNLGRLVEERKILSRLLGQ